MPIFWRRFKVCRTRALHRIDQTCGSSHGVFGAGCGRRLPSEYRPCDRPFGLGSQLKDAGVYHPMSMIWLDANEYVNSAPDRA
jgi:hypothetical protein